MAGAGVGVGLGLGLGVGLWLGLSPLKSSLKAQALSGDSSQPVGILLKRWHCEGQLFVDVGESVPDPETPFSFTFCFVSPAIT